MHIEGLGGSGCQDGRIIPVADVIPRVYVECRFKTKQSQFTVCIWRLASSSLLRSSAKPRQTNAIANKRAVSTSPFDFASCWQSSVTTTPTKDGFSSRYVSQNFPTRPGHARKSRPIARKEGEFESRRFSEETDDYGECTVSSSRRNSRLLLTLLIFSCIPCLFAACRRLVYPTQRLRLSPAF